MSEDSERGVIRQCTPSAEKKKANREKECVRERKRKRKGERKKERKRDH